MKKTPRARRNKRKEMRPEYKRSDFGKLERGKYYDRVRANTNVVVLDPDVASVFHSPEAVNSLLRSVIQALPERAKA